MLRLDYNVQEIKTLETKKEELRKGERSKILVEISIEELRNSPEYKEAQSE